MYLATTASTTFWKVCDEVLLLGPWCLRHDQKIEWDGLQYAMVPNPWSDQRVIEGAAQYCNTVIDSLMADLAVWLNQTHGMQRSERYWRILLGPWLLYYVHAIYDRYTSLQRALESCSGLWTHVLVPSVYQTPTDTSGFVSLAYEDSADEFNFQLYSQILRALSSDSITLKEIELPVKGQYKGGALQCGVQPGLRAGQAVPRRIAGQMNQTLIRLLSPHVMLCNLDLDRSDLFRLIRRLSFRAWSLSDTQQIRCPNVPAQEALRRSLSQITWNDQFTRVLVETLSTNFPLIYLEGYADFLRISLKSWSKQPKLMISSFGWYVNETFKFLAAEYSEKGARLVGIQHGGGYGTSQAIPQERYEIAITDRWLSFGWQDDRKHSKVKPSSHPRFIPLCSRNDRCAESKIKILLVAISHPRYPFRFESHPIGEFEGLLTWRIRFIQALPASLRTQLLVRLNTLDYGWCQKERLSEACGPLRFDDHGKSFRDVMGQVALVVVEYCGTAFLEVLAANIPTVLFWDPSLYGLREEAQPYFEGLRKVGILWDSPEAAAAKTEAVYGRPWDWWGSNAVQEVRQRFVERYALGREDWLDCWAQHVKEELVLSGSDGARQ